MGVDLNRQMLALAKKRCSGWKQVQFVESSVCPLDISSSSIDTVVCQQGFQFFENKEKAAREIYRVLRGGGKIIATTWRPVAECQFFGVICEALNEIGEPEISDIMRVPFDFLTESELAEPFALAGFDNVRLEKQQLDLVLEGGAAQGLEVA